MIHFNIVIISFAILNLNIFSRESFELNFCMFDSLKNYIHKNPTLFIRIEHTEMKHNTFFKIKSIHIFLFALPIYTAICAFIT